MRRKIFRYATIRDITGIFERFLGVRSARESSRQDAKMPGATVEIVVDLVGVAGCGESAQRGRM
jgi:hypothetical protein